jgi:transcriptional regulator with XRE-family HTH domain
MGRKPKQPADAAFFIELEKKNPKAAYMRKKCAVIGMNIREHRRQRRFSVENLAEYLELSESYIGLLERGDRCPSLKIVYKLCDLYGVTPNSILIAPDDDPVDGVIIAEDKEAYNVKKQSEAIVSLLRTLNDTETDFIIETIKNLRKIGK